MLKILLIINLSYIRVFCVRKKLKWNGISKLIRLNFISLTNKKGIICNINLSIDFNEILRDIHKLMQSVKRIKNWNKHYFNCWKLLSSSNTTFKIQEGSHLSMCCQSIRGKQLNSKRFLRPFSICGSRGRR